MSSAKVAVSVLTVVRNDASGLARTIASIRAVRRRSSMDIRYIVVDGASTDGTIDVIASHLDSIDHWISEPDRGIYDAMNKAARLADPDSWLLWMNAGDELLDIDELLAALPMPAIDAVFAAIRLPGGLTIRPRIRVPYTECNLFPRTVFRHQGFFLRGESFAALGGYRLDVGSQADGLLMSQAVQSLRWAESSAPAAVFQLDGVSNTNHRAVLRSYFKVVRALDMSLPATLWFQRSYVFKMLLKIALPAAITTWVMRRRSEIA